MVQAPPNAAQAAKVQARLNAAQVAIEQTCPGEGCRRPDSYRKGTGFCGK